MSLPKGRGCDRVRSCGLTRKWVWEERSGIREQTKERKDPRVRHRRAPWLRQWQWKALYGKSAHISSLENVEGPNCKGYRPGEPFIQRYIFLCRWIEGECSGSRMKRKLYLPQSAGVFAWLTMGRCGSIKKAAHLGARPGMWHEVHGTSYLTHVPMECWLTHPVDAGIRWPTGSDHKAWWPRK